TNDAWYGRKPWYARTSALWQHPSHLVMRAIENRVGIARAGNTGISMFVDPLGHTYDRTPLFQPAMRADTVYTTNVTTLYVRWGDWLATGASAAGVILVLLAWLGARGKLGSGPWTTPRRPLPPRTAPPGGPGKKGAAPPLPRPEQPHGDPQPPHHRPDGESGGAGDGGAAPTPACRMARQDRTFSPARCALDRGSGIY
ncbi:MAG TPA: hypothetical protein VJ957_05290, partial [Longimicrobiales bacterium]|nr:hypothetical protein [Longimicrobiales bacterium]